MFLHRRQFVVSVTSQTWTPTEHHRRQLLHATGHVTSASSGCFLSVSSISVDIWKHVRSQHALGFTWWILSADRSPTQPHNQWVSCCDRSSKKTNQIAPFSDLFLTQNQFLPASVLMINMKNAEMNNLQLAALRWMYVSSPDLCTGAFWVSKQVINSCSLNTLNFIYYFQYEELLKSTDFLMEFGLNFVSICS